MAESVVEILDSPSHNASQNLPYHLVGDTPDHREEANYHQLSMVQQMPDRANPQHERRRDSSASMRHSIVVTERLDKYVCYRLFKKDRSWKEATHQKMSLPQSQLEKMAQRGKKSVKEEMRSMGAPRQRHFQYLIEKLEAEENGYPNITWEPVFIKKSQVKTRSRTRSGVEVESMDVVLERVPNLSTISTVVGQKTDANPTRTLVVFRDKKAKDGEWLVNGRGNSRASRQYHYDHYRPRRRDSMFDDEEDPLGSRSPFRRNGVPLENYGPTTFDNAGRPPLIPQGPVLSQPPSPLPLPPPSPQRQQQRQRQQQQEPFLLQGTEWEPEEHERGPKRRAWENASRNEKYSVDDLLGGRASGKGDHRGFVGRRQDKSRSRSRPKIFTEARGSHSRHRQPSESRANGFQSKSHLPDYHDEHRFPHVANRGGVDVEVLSFSSSSMGSDDRSSFGLEPGDGSSNTSHDNYQGKRVAGRGANYHDDGYEEHYSKSRGSKYRNDKKDYKEYSRGPPSRQVVDKVRSYSMNGGRQSQYHNTHSYMDMPATGGRRRRATASCDGDKVPIIHYQSDIPVVDQMRPRLAMNDEGRYERNFKTREGGPRRELRRGTYHDDKWQYSRDHNDDNDVGVAYRDH